MDSRHNYELLRYENVRLSTFDDWPTSSLVQPSALARAGLFYTGQGDRTGCAFCRGVLHSWQREDNPYVEHRRHFPRCPFVLQRDVGNVAVQPYEMPALCDTRLLERQTTTKTNSVDDEKQMLINENRRLLEEKTCKVCMENEVNVVFIPCGHLVCCERCLPKLYDCPVCRTYIQSTVKTFLC